MLHLEIGIFPYLFQDVSILHFLITFHQPFISPSPTAKHRMRGKRPYNTLENEHHLATLLRPTQPSTAGIWCLSIYPTSGPAFWLHGVVEDWDGRCGCRALGYYSQAVSICGENKELIGSPLLSCFNHPPPPFNILLHTVYCCLPLFPCSHNASWRKTKMFCLSVSYWTPSIMHSTVCLSLESSNLFCTSVAIGNVFCFRLDKSNYCQMLI